MRIDESALPEGWEDGLAIERDRDGAICRIASGDGVHSQVLELGGGGFVYRDAREIRWPNPDGVDAGTDPAVLLRELVGRFVSAGPSNVPTCSFCGKSAHEVSRLIAGPSVYICDECVTLCSEILST